MSDNWIDRAVKDASTRNSKGALKPLLDQIGQLEASGKYNIEYGGRALPLDKMTLGQVMAHQNARQKQGAASTAVGKYQFIDSTLKSIVDRNPKEFPLSRKFDKAAQDRAAEILLERRGLQDYLSGKLSKEDFGESLSKEWASLPNPKTGKSYYDGDGLNKSLISNQDFMKTLAGLAP